MALPLRPLVAIIGTTGTGKSKLAIELAKHLRTIDGCSGAQVINADAMQVYAGMDIITNKVTESDMQGVEHRLLGFRQPGRQYNVGDWVSDATSIISETHAQNKVPIVVGGTSYWIQHLVFPGSVNYEDPRATSGQSTVSPELAQSLSQLPHELFQLYTAWPDLPPSASTHPEVALLMYKLLHSLDPKMGARWHWRDTRKVHRSLSIIRDSGRRASDRVLDQSQVRVAPRYRTLFFWLYAPSSVMYPRLDARVDDMLQKGLIEEVRALQSLKDSGDDLDFTTGIYQSIGYREFHEYLSRAEPDDAAFSSAVQKMKTSTKQYAKSQISWIRNKLLPEVRQDEETVSTYLLDVTDLDNGWLPNVQEPAFKIIEDFVHGSLESDPCSLSDAANQMLTIPEKETNPLSRLEARRMVICDICTTDKDRPVLVDEEGFDKHQRSRTHRTSIRKAERRERMEAYFRGLAAKGEGSRTDSGERLTDSQ